MNTGRMGHDTNRARRPPLGFLVILVFLVRLSLHIGYMIYPHTRQK